MTRRVVKMTAAFAALTAWAATSCEGPIEPPPQGPIPWERYEVRGLPEGWAVYDVYMLSPGEGWAVAEGPYFLYFDGAEWAVHTAFTTKYPDVDVTRLAFSSPDDGWAVGHELISSGRCEVYFFHYDGERWASVTEIPIEIEYRYPALYDVEALAADDVWLTAGRSVLHYDGETWEDYALHSEVFGLSFSDPKDGWAVGGNHFYRWDGTAWEQVYNETYYAVLDVASPGPRAAWAVGGSPGGG
jgi:hypothetical protein